MISYFLGMLLLVRYVIRYDNMQIYDFVTYFILLCYFHVELPHIWLFMGQFNTKFNISLNTKKKHAEIY